MKSKQSASPRGILELALCYFGLLYASIGRLRANRTKFRTLATGQPHEENGFSHGFGICREE
ncbi:hypothetical protein [Paenibacillus sp. J22TS3]|uniref:hypothetical protein n=1 Tax=Paenibacillus sp. J22TS3 TaxID=2807192 RepID=UPI001BCD88B2|nr:hypothetical protein [Paenibacillus sp. J22TS3]